MAEEGAHRFVALAAGALAGAFPLPALLAGGGAERLAPAKACVGACGAARRGAIAGSTRCGSKAAIL